MYSVNEALLIDAIDESIVPMNSPDSVTHNEFIEIFGRDKPSEVLQKSIAQWMKRSGIDEKDVGIKIVGGLVKLSLNTSDKLSFDSFQEFVKGFRKYFNTLSLQTYTVYHGRFNSRMSEPEMERLALRLGE